jgi:peptidoglycan/xylan/chitin deacetylase (PgdA/CDA1 family)
MQYCTTFAAFQSFQGNMLRRKGRNLVLDALSLTNTLEKNKKVLETPRVQFLYFHHIFKDEVANFEKLVRFLAKGHTFITHSEAVRRIAENDIDRPYIAWSSDDGIWNNMLAADILNKYGASCCFYVNPFSIGLTDDVEVKRFCKERLDMPPVNFLSWNDLTALQKKGHEIGNHTYDHSMVSQLSLDEFALNFNKAQDVLTANCDKIVHFAYTYGKFEHFNKAAYDFVFEQGYDSCTSAVRGCHINGLNELSKNKLFLRRDQIIGNWPLEHITYFMIQSAANARFSTNYLPETYLS